MGARALSPSDTRAAAPGERGVALVTSLMMMFLVSSLLVGFTLVVMSDSKLRGIDQNRSQAFYASHAGLEKLTADLGNLFEVNFAPTRTQLDGLQTTSVRPALSGVTYVAADGTSGYALSFPPDGNGNPQASNHTILSGPYQGLQGLITPYTIDVTARTPTNGEVHLERTVNTVTIPVFQFGTFSDTDLSFFAGPNFNFGGRVHTNGNLFLASGATLTMADRITAVGEVVRTNLSNGWQTSTNYTGNVAVAYKPGATRNLLTTEGSLTATLGSSQNEPTWTNVSLGAYHGYIRNVRTGAKRLDLPLITVGGQTTDLIRRPGAANEDTANPTLFGQRYFSMASLRILLSDTPQAIQNLPTVTQATQPVLLDWTGGPPAGYTVDATHPPLAVSAGLAPGPAAITTTTTVNTLAGAATIQVNSIANFVVPGDIFVNGRAVWCTGAATNLPGPRFTGCVGTPATNAGVTVETGYRTPLNTSLIGGYIKIEKQDINGVWSDVTLDILNLGMAGKQLSNAGLCNPQDPNPNAVIRIERLKDNPGGCNNGSVTATDYWPNALFDTREGNVRDSVATNTTTVTLGGVMSYVELDVNNLRRWLQGGIGAQGANAMNVTGYVVYFSDRRNNRNAGGQETAEYGVEDFVNPITVTGTPNAVLDAGEDINTNGALDAYGQTPIVPAGGIAPLNNAATPFTAVAATVAQVNRPLFFRRALKIVNGTLGNVIAPGLTVASENPVYLRGDYNASAANGFGNPHVATAFMADALTLLSNNWNDRSSFLAPEDPAQRTATDTWYRFAVISGKGPSFPRPTGWVSPQDFGTDGGAHNFLRYLEDWGGRTLNYRGAIASFYYNRQALGTYKCCTNVYKPPTRGYNFDVDFLTPALLPPRTPMFRDVNTTGFTQITQPGK